MAIIKLTDRPAVGRTTHRKRGARSDSRTAPGAALYFFIAALNGSLTFGNLAITTFCSLPPTFSTF